MTLEAITVALSLTFDLILLLLIVNLNRKVDCHRHRTFMRDETNRLFEGETSWYPDFPRNVL